jgi:hypothetical protein
MREIDVGPPPGLSRAIYPFYAQEPLHAL